MSSARVFLLLLAIGATTAPAARADTVHFSFTDPHNVVIFHATSGLIPWNQTAGPLAQFDLYFDPTTATSLDDGQFRFTDPAKNFWRARIETVALGDFTITRPLQDLSSEDYGFSFTHFVAEPGRYEQLDFRADFAEQISSDGELPGQFIPSLTTPLPPDAHGGTYFFLQGGTTFFPVKNLAEAYGYGTFRTARVERIGSFLAVPEPTTYAFGAWALIALVMALPRLRRSRPLAC